MRLFVLRSCPYCVRVLQAIKDTPLQIEVIDVPGPHNMRSAVKEASGQTYVPTLVDGETVIADDDDRIILYLKQKEEALISPN